MNESQMKQERASNANLEKERRNYLSSLFNGTSNTKRQRLYQEFGYPVDLCFEDFYRACRRNAVAGAAVSRMVDGCWEDFPEIYEGDKTKDATKQTPWDKRVNKLLKRCWKQIKGADRRNLVGRYSALLIQVKDSKPWREPVDTVVAGRLAEKALVKLIPAWEAQIEPIEWDSDPESETFGDVTMYSFIELSVGNNKDARPGRIINVHPDRVIILAEGSDDGSMTSGRSMLEEGFNKLLDLEKVSGGGAEGFLKNASRQLNFNFSSKTNFAQLARALGVTEAELSNAMDDQVRRLNDSTDSAVMMQEGDASVLSVAVADPEPTWRTALNEFCATVPIPVKVLIGMQTGERASTEDAKGLGQNPHESP
ncbi:gp5 [Raoultella ornithinolytica]|nr:gp5 [Raoultella ornithinolytica]